MRIEGLKKYRGRNPSGYFHDLPWEVRNRAHQWLNRFMRRWGRNMPRWRFAILVGQAKRLALNPPTSAWGRSMRAKKGGYAVQRKYRLEGRNPTAIATHMSKHIRRARKQRKLEAEERARLGVPAPERIRYLPLD